MNFENCPDFSRLSSFSKAIEFFIETFETTNWSTNFPTKDPLKMLFISSDNCDPIKTTQPFIETLFHQFQLVIRKIFSLSSNHKKKEKKITKNICRIIQKIDRELDEITIKNYTYVF